MELKLKKSVSILTMAAFFAGSLALCTAAEAKKRHHNYHPNANHISWSALVQKLEGDGYQIREIEMKRNGWKADVIQDGNRHKLRLDESGNELSARENR